MKYPLLSALILWVTTIAAPCLAQYTSFSSSSDSCSNLCFKVDLGSTITDGSSFGSNSFNNGFNSGSSSGSNGVRWQVGITWRPGAPEFSLAEADRIKRQLEDNRSLTIALAEAIAQNKTEMANGLAILLAPRLGYKDPRKLIADLKEGSMNIGAAKVEMQSTPTIAPVPIAPPPNDRREGTTIVIPASVQPPGTPAPPTIIELR
ncbi:hypothetical protein [Chamaesiphon minutus]|uniref:Uncharacterized protein n=1 Tax=Chamaesiphon minutus (strain ATCC 27169 / PCC 6605) TaxID=1173020 RepID=K9ULA6_CHAP6|nr:hypothetical protein [Chamaesiphon minutus]AFY94979.1 hypothetical protein Cha6605_4018 [Chamaesiphon minutus PCC 6605]